MKKGLILTDCMEKERDIFLEELNNKTNVCFENMTLNFSRYQKGLSRIVRYFSYIFIPLYVLAFGKKYEYIVAWQQFYGLFYAFWCNLFKLKKKKTLIVMTFIYKEKMGIVGRIYKKLMKNIVRSGYIDSFICFSQIECKYYADLFGVKKSLFYECKLNLSDQYAEFEKNIRNGNYYFAAGRSNRDYDFLCKAFAEYPNRKLIIVCDNYKNKNCAENIEILDNVYGEQYFRYLAGSKAIIIPLKDNVVVSSGQMVAIHGLMFGKVVIATDNDQMKEYIHNLENGFLIKNSVEQLDNVLTRIEMLELGSLYKKARESYLNNFSQSNRSDIVELIIKNSH